MSLSHKIVVLMMLYAAPNPLGIGSESALLSELDESGKILASCSAPSLLGPICERTPPYEITGAADCAIQGPRGGFWGTRAQGGPGGTQFRLVPSFAFIVEGTRGALYVDLDFGRFHPAGVLF